MDTVTHYAPTLFDAPQAIYSRPAADEIARALTHPPTLAKLRVRAKALDPRRADDLVQATALRGLERAPFAYTAGTDPTAWLLTVLRSAFLDQLRNDKRRPHGRLQGPADDGRHPLDRVAADDQLIVDPALVAAIAELRPSERVPLQLRIEGHSYSAIADRLGVGVVALRQRVCSARQQLRARLPDYAEAVA